MRGSSVADLLEAGEEAVYYTDTKATSGRKGRPNEMRGGEKKCIILLSCEAKEPSADVATEKDCVKKTVTTYLVLQTKTFYFLGTRDGKSVLSSFPIHLERGSGAGTRLVLAFPGVHIPPLSLGCCTERERERSEEILKPESNSKCPPPGIRGRVGRGLCALNAVSNFSALRWAEVKPSSLPRLLLFGLLSHRQPTQVSRPG